MSTSPYASPGSGPATVSSGFGGHALIWLCLGLLGALVGWGLPVVARWVTELPWFPLQGPAELVTSWQDSWAPPVLIALGAAGGLLLAAWFSYQMVVITVDRAEVETREGENRRSLAREAVGAVYYDGKDLVLADPHGVEVHRIRPEGTPAEVAQAFTGHGWPWRDADPHAGHLTRWVEGTTELPAEANALLAARARALKADDADDAAHLTTQLGRLGFVVRDHDGRQHWRRLGTT